MAITVKKAVLWRTEVDNRPGALASALEPLAQAGADLQVVMAYCFATRRVRPFRLKARRPQLGRRAFSVLASRWCRRARRG